MAEQEKETQEVEAKETESNYEIVDDTPEEDKNVEPYDGDAEPTPDELDKYSGKVKNRIEKLTKRYHDERRIKEKKEKEMEGKVLSSDDEEKVYTLKYVD